MILKELREQVVAAGVGLLRTGLVTVTWGNISARDRATGYVTITPSGMEYDKITPGDIVVLGPDGRVIEGTRKPSSETPMHLLIYSKKPEVGGIVHTHSTYATAMGVLGLEIPLVIGELANAVGGPVKTARFAPEGTRELGVAAVEGMGETAAVILANHGVVATGPSLKDAFFNAVVVEDAAKVFYLAKAIGKPATIPPEEAARLHEEFLSSYGQK
ncbi:MAG: class II aldolase/adducin family protein [Ignavibacteriales bacterium]